MDREENLQDVPKRDERRIERQLEDLGVAGGTGTDLIVGWVRIPAARVTGLHLLYAPQLIKNGLQAPEAAARKRGNLGGR